MSNQNHKRSKITGSLWMGMAVFFLVFCSSPVKRYIRLHLYNQKFVVVDIKGDHFNTHDIKDCLIADRHQQTEINILSFLQHPANDLPDDVSFLPPATLPSLAFTFFRKDDGRYVAYSLSRGKPASVPLYLWVRHLQV